MNPSRLITAFLLVVPALLFIAAAESAPDAPAAPAAQEEAQPAATKSPAPAQAAPAATPPLRTMQRPDALPGEALADASATSAIEGAIRSDPALAGSDISVNTERGVVSLTGRVANREQSAIASAYANRQLGVLRVDNDLSIPAQ
jgi:osmotically-inducible protein OsmY